MPRKNRSLQAQIAQHEKYRRQGEILIRSFLMLCATAVGLYAVLLLKNTVSWFGGLPLIAPPAFFTALQLLEFIRHEKPLKDLISNEALAEPTPSTDA